MDIHESTNVYRNVEGDPALSDDELSYLSSSFIKEETLRRQDFEALMALTEAVVEVPEDAHPRIGELLQTLANASSGMSRSQIAELLHTTRSVLGEIDPKMEYIDHMLSEAGRFAKRLMPHMTRALRGVDTEILETFLEERQRKPYIGAKEIEAAHGSAVQWADIIRQRLSNKLDSDDIDTLVRALYEVYDDVYIGGNSGMGRGEVLYMVLADGEKPQRGDLLVPGVGELEIKGSGGRMRGVTLPVGSIKTTFKALMKMIEQEYPEIIEAKDRLPKVSPKGSSSFLSLTKKNLNEQGYPILNEVLETDERRRWFYRDLWGMYFSTLHDENYDELDKQLFEKIVESFAKGDFEKGAVAISAAQYQLYAHADGFDAMLLVDPHSFFLIHSAEDIISSGSIRKGVAPLKIDPPSIAPGDEPGAAAGLSIS